MLILLLLSEGAENWMYYKTMGKKIILRKDVIPQFHINTPNANVSVSQLTPKSEKKIGGIMCEWTCRKTVTFWE